MDKTSDVKQYYDRFSKRVLLDDFYYPNARQLEIKKLCKRFIRKGAAVLEIGCGVGIITKYLQKRAQRIVAVDISEVNIEIASLYARSPNCEFRVMDVLEQREELEKLGRFDVVLLPDVIEHLPKDRHSEVFASLEKILAPGGRVLLTYPSPEYQEHLRIHKPEALQLIDETLHLPHILSATSLKPIYLSYRDVWGRNQYVHLVLDADRRYSDDPHPGSPWAKLSYRLRKYRWRFGNLLFLRKVKRRIGKSH